MTLFGVHATLIGTASMLALGLAVRALQSFEQSGALSAAAAGAAAVLAAMALGAYGVWFVRSGRQARGTAC